MLNKLKKWWMSSPGEKLCSIGIHKDKDPNPIGAVYCEKCGIINMEKTKITMYKFDKSLVLDSKGNKITYISKA